MVHRSILAMLVLLLAGCDQELGCSGEGFDIGTQPRLSEGQALDPGAAVVVTADGAQFFADNIEPLARTLLELPPGQFLDLSALLNTLLELETLSIAGIALDDVVFKIALPRSSGSVRAEFRPNPDRVHIEIDELWVLVEATVINPSDVASFACRIRGKLDENTADERMLTVRDIALDVLLDNNGSGFDVQLDQVSFDLFESGIDIVADRNDPDYYCNFSVCQDGLSGCAECHAICGGGSLLEDLVSFFIEFFDDLLGGLVEVVGNTLLDRPLLVEGELHPALLLGSLLPDLLDSHRLNFAVRSETSDAFEVHTSSSGNSLSVELGFGTEPTQIHPCIGDDPGSPRFLVGPPPNANNSDTNHVVFEFPSATLNQALWSFYRAGGLCLQITSEDIARLSGLLGANIELTAGTASLLLPGLDSVVGKNTPLMLSLTPYFVPEEPELFKLGKAGESLFRVNLPRMELGLFAWIEGRYLRLFGAEARIMLALTPTLRPDRKIDLALDDVVVDGLNETYNELFVASELEPLFQYVVELALGILVGQGIEVPIDTEALLGTLLGLPLDVEITGLETGGAAQDWLQVGLRLGLNPTEFPILPHRHSVETYLEPLPGKHGLIAHLTTRVAHHSSDDVEVQLRVDGGPWRRWQPAGNTELSGGLMLLPGRHVVEARGRLRHAPAVTLDMTPARLEIETYAAVQPSASPAKLVGASPQDRASCSQFSTPRPRSEWFWVIWIVALWVLRSRKSRLLLVSVWLGLTFLVGCSDEKQINTTPCERDRDCPGRQACSCAGLCYSPISCTTDSTCCAGEQCVEGRCQEMFDCDNSDACAPGELCGGCMCRLPRCVTDQQCSEGLVCIAGACSVSQNFPCPAGCAEGEVCIGELRRCWRAPESCAGQQCTLGEVLVVENATAYIGALCQEEAVKCACSQPDGQIIAGEPTGYLAAHASRDGRIAVAAYDLATRDVAVRWIHGDEERVVDEALYIDGLPNEGATVLRSERAALGPGPDRGAELDMAIDDDDRLVLVYRDRSANTLRFAHSADSTTWTQFELDSEGLGGRWPAVEARPGGGWVVAYQHVAHIEDKTFRTSLRLTEFEEAEPRSAQSASVLSIAEGEHKTAFFDVHFGVGATPDLARLEDRWFAVYHDGTQGALQMATWTTLDDVRVHTVVSPETRGGISGGSTGVSPQLIADASLGLNAVYLDATSGELRHAKWSYTAASDMLSEVDIRTIDPGLAGSPQRVIALDIDLTQAPDGRLVVAYQDATNADMYIAIGDGTGWTSSRWSGIGGTGFFPRVVWGAEQEATLIYGRWSFPAQSMIQQELVVQSYTLEP